MNISAARSAVWDVAKLYYFLPIFVIQRSVELALLRREHFERPLLDLGCGDGQFGRLLFPPQGVDVGLDLEPREVARARATGIYRETVAADAHAIPLSNASFATIFSNSTLEHIPRLDGVFAEFSRLLRVGGQVIATAPTEHFPALLKTVVRARAKGNDAAGERHRRWVDEVLGHVNYLSLDDWENLASHHGFRLARVRTFLSPTVMAWFDRSLVLQARLRAMNPTFAGRISAHHGESTYQSDGRPKRGVISTLAATVLAACFFPLTLRELRLEPATGGQRLVILEKVAG